VSQPSLPGRLVLLGHPLAHSLSPVFQNAALRAAGIPLVYEALDVPRSAFEDTVLALRRARAAGNVTVPYKEAMRDACDRLTPVAAAVGAVNTFWTAVDGALVGDNTDVGGFSAAARDLLGGEPRDQVVALLGAGGGAAAVLHAVKGWPGSRALVYARTGARADALVRRLDAPATVVESADAAVTGATLLVNATPVGLRDDDLPISPDLLDAPTAVLDLAYGRSGTALVRAARARGLVAADGLGMLVHQGALAFERWFGTAPDLSVMWSALPHTY